MAQARRITMGDIKGDMVLSMNMSDEVWLD